MLVEDSVTQNYILELYFLYYSGFIQILGLSRQIRTGNLKVCIGLGIYDFDTRTVTPSQYTSIRSKFLKKSREKVRLKRAFGLSDFFCEIPCMKKKVYSKSGF